MNMSYLYLGTETHGIANSQQAVANLRCLCAVCEVWSGFDLIEVAVRLVYVTNKIAHKLSWMLPSYFLCPSYLGLLLCSIPIFISDRKTFALSGDRTLVISY